MSQKFIDAVDGAHYVFVNYDAQVVYVWHGGLTVNVYDWQGNAIDCFTMGDEPNCVREVHDHIIEYRDNRD